MKHREGSFEYHAGQYQMEDKDRVETSGQVLDDLLGARQDIKETIEWVRQIPPAICFSRVIGVGALEIADVLGGILGHRVIEQQILRHITEELKRLDAKTGSIDTRYPLEVVEYLSLLFSTKGFKKTDFSQHLFAAVLSIAGLAPTIFVGWGTHLILPRERTLAVRLVCSDGYRIERLSKIFNSDPDAIQKKLHEVDARQKRFFAETFDRQKAFAHEFDLILNCDRLRDPRLCARTVAAVFNEKFKHHSAAFRHPSGESTAGQSLMR